MVCVCVNKVAHTKISDAIVFVVAISTKIRWNFIGFATKIQKQSRRKKQQTATTTKHIKSVWKINILKIRQLLPACQPLLLTNISLLPINNANTSHCICKSEPLWLCVIRFTITQQWNTSEWDIKKLKIWLFIEFAPDDRRRSIVSLSLSLSLTRFTLPLPLILADCLITCTNATFSTLTRRDVTSQRATSNHRVRHSKQWCTLIASFSRIQWIVVIHLWQRALIEITSKANKNHSFNSYSLFLFEINLCVSVFQCYSSHFVSLFFSLAASLVRWIGFYVFPKINRSECHSM